MGEGEKALRGFSLGGEGETVWNLGQSHKLWLDETFASPE